MYIIHLYTDFEKHITYLTSFLIEFLNVVMSASDDVLYFVGDRNTFLPVVLFLFRTPLALTLCKVTVFRNESNHYNYIFNCSLFLYVQNIRKKDDHGQLKN